MKPHHRKKPAKGHSDHSKSRIFIHHARYYSQNYKAYLLAIALALLFFGVFFIPVSHDTNDDLMPSVLKLESIDVCEGFDSVISEAVGCNHIFNDVDSLVVFYYVSFNQTPFYNLSITWNGKDGPLQVGVNDFTYKGSPVEPGEYLLAMQTDFNLSVGNYTIDLYEGPYFLGYISFQVLS